MQGHFYFNAIRKQAIQFLDLFNNIKIARYNSDGTIIKYIEVPIKYSPKMKQWNWIKDHILKKKEDLIFPFIGVELNSIQWSQQRVVSKYDKITVERNDIEYNLKYIYNPVPYDFGFRVTIACQYMVDLDQILEQILPFFNPFLNIKLTIPEIGIIDDNSLDLRVILNGVNPEVQDEIPIQDYRYINYSLEFMVQGYMFLPSIERPTIKTVKVNSYISVNEDDEEPDTRDPISEHILTGYSTELINLYPPSTGEYYHDEDIPLLYKYEIIDKVHD